ncbi:MAG: anthranilate synthase component I family protein [Pirellulales bacterium]
MTSPEDVAAADFPLVAELRPMPEAEAVFLALASLPHCAFFDSAQRHPELGRYSFVAADPYAFVVEHNEGCAAATRGSGLPEETTFDRLRARFRRHSQRDGSPLVRPRADLPPFQGGVAGWFSYELLHQLEKVPLARFDEFDAPRLALGWYDTVVAFDHAWHRAWIVSQGLPETDPARRRRRAEGRLAWFAERLTTASEPPQLNATEPDRYVAPSQLAPQYPIDAPPGLTSNFSRRGYLDAVARAIEYIRAGDMFQVNLSQRLLYPAAEHAAALYLRLRQRNPAPFAGYFDAGEFQIASASPERFLAVRGREVETRPIKGTRPRLALPEADLYAGDDLLASEKDRAENVMIVDLLRNDLSRVCRDDSVRVTQLCRIETYQFVQHLVSAVCGTLRGDATAIDLLAAAFPGGSITGAPKVRAMQIIAELEPTTRGPYCGSLGYLGFDGGMDTNLLIRTVTAGRGWWQAPVGGGIVAQSTPEREYAETWHKAEGLLRAFR